MEELEQYTIDLEPIGRRTHCTVNQSILEAAQRAGIDIVAVCGGAGSCGKCRIRLIEGKLNAPTAVEQRIFKSADLEKGLRLACQAYPRSDVKIGTTGMPADKHAPIIHHGDISSKISTFLTEIGVIELLHPVCAEFSYEHIPIPILFIPSIFRIKRTRC